MNQEKENPNDIHDELKPVKDKPKKKLSLGCTLAISATVAVVIVGLVGPATTTQGAPRSARLSFEQRKTQIEQQIAQSHNDAESETSESDPAR
jgi:hypothetical protein